ncbi:MAG: AAA family ATPase [Synechococcales bacterium]|nr:AAA family ATPase [Synechococcales bacterium]
MTLPASIHTLQTLILSYHPIIVIETLEEERVENLLKAATHEMQMPLFEWTVTQGLVRSPGTYDAPWINECAPPGSNRPVAFENTTDPMDLLGHLLEKNRKSVFLLKDFAKHLDDAVLARQLREVAHIFSQTCSTLVITGDTISLSREIAHDAVFYDLPLPGRDELYQAVSEVVRTLKAKNRISIELQKHEVHVLVQALSGMTLRQARQVVAYAALEDGKLTLQDVNRILHRKAQVLHQDGLLDYLPVQENTAELGGFNGLKDWLSRAKVGFSPQARAMNLTPPKGILIVGIQGCGKSLAAKAIAREWKMPLLKLDAGKLYDKYIGESEKNFHRAIKLAESMAPTVLWIDEIEKSMGISQTDSDGGLSRRLFGSLLTWMQEKSQDVFVVATANNLSQVPPELLRKGRFDEIFFVDLPNETERATILKIHLTLRKQNPQTFDMDALVAATDGFSGAEIEQAVISGLYRALYLKTELDTELMLKEIKSTVPLSVSRREDLQQLQAIAQERFVSAR